MAKAKATRVPKVKVQPKVTQPKATSRSTAKRPASVRIGGNKTAITKSMLEGLSQRQKYKLLGRLAETEQIATRGKGDVIKSVGRAFAEASTPIATNITAQRTAEQAVAARRANADSALAQWNANIDGDPSGEGSSGSTQGNSTTETTSAGPFRSIID